MTTHESSFTASTRQTASTSSAITVLARLLAVVLALAVLLGLNTSEAFGSSGARPPHAYFGMHYHAVGRDGSWPDAPVGFMRLWDTGTSWREIQPERARWDFSILDAAVANARAHHAKVSLVLGQSPVWASSRPAEANAFYGAGAAAPPASITDWWIYVNTVAARYRGRIAAYEIWNEANLPGFYSGSIAQMVRLTRIGRDAIKRADPAASVLGPSVTLRGGVRYMSAFAKAGGYRYSDAVNVHGYPMPTVGPEAGVAMVDRARRAIAGYEGGRKPMWNTEMNYGLPTLAGGGIATPWSSRRQAAFVIRAYLLNWSHGVRRMAWYDWGTPTFEGVRMSAGADRAAAPGQAFGTVRDWMRGRVQHVEIDRRGVYRVTVIFSAHRAGSIRGSRQERASRSPPSGPSSSVTSSAMRRRRAPVPTSGSATPR